MKTCTMPSARGAGAVPVACALLIALAALGCRAPQTTPDSRAAPPEAAPGTAANRVPATLLVSSSAFSEAQTIPARFTGDGENLSPPLEWSAPPAGTQELALVMDDPDAPSGDFTHWLLWGIRPDRAKLPEDIAKSAAPKQPAGAKQGVNDAGKVGYAGPAPPPGPQHRYYVTIYALDAPLKLASKARRQDLDAAIQGHVVAAGTLMGMYGR
jgi:Raf kinase inhibitor-like YbhB/YbcL family protein